MKKFIGVLLLSASIFNVYSQDSIYYATAFNSKDDVLKFNLNTIIKDHVEFTYTSSSTDVWDILKETDRDTNNAENVILIYSGRSVDAAQEYNSGNGWTREHVWAKSRGDFGTSNGPGTDVHHLRPCDNGVNSSRNNRNFDTCITCVDVIDNGFNTGSKRDANLWTFEPPDEVKGDVARMIFYMAVRYEGASGEPDLELTNTLLNNSDQSPLQGVLNTLLVWNREDSVSNWEKNRNQIIFDDYQGNRNPFIDYPELAEHLWGDSMGVVWMPEVIDTTIGTGFINIQNEKVEIFPNPTTGSLYIKGDYKSIELFSLDGRSLQIDNDNPDISNYPDGLYLIRIEELNNLISFKKVIKRSPGLR